MNVRVRTLLDYVCFRFMVMLPFGSSRSRSCKNYLFAGSDAGAERAATMYSIFGTCTLLGINPREYLMDVLPRLARPYALTEIDSFLTHAWAEKHRVATAT